MRVGFFLCLVSGIAAGCGGADTPCGERPPTPRGQFQAQYFYLSGNCPPQPQGHPVLLDPGTSGVNEIEMNRSADRVEAVLVYKGCSIGLTYNVLTKPTDEEPSLFISAVDGNMDVEAEDELTGTVTRVEYDPPGTVFCQGEYDMVLSKNDVTLGAAAD